jgi:riboflavin biosynthesis pyrimidine reductase
LTLDEARRAWRERNGLSRYPQMVVVSYSLELDPGQPGVAGAVVLTTGDRENAALARVAEIVRCENLADGLELLRRLGLRHLLCEGGPRLFAALTALDLVDELCLTVSPLLAGAGAGRITAGRSHPALRMKLQHVLTSQDGNVLLRHSRREPPPAT